MAKKRISSVRCPTCRTLVLKRDPEFPFCSERCRTIDLGKWASGGHVISSPIDRGDESGEADYTTGLARRVPGPASAVAATRSEGHDQELHDHDRKRQ
jgi:hypothetical protein